MAVVDENQLVNFATQVRTFGRHLTHVELPNLVKLQTESYARFLQADVPQNRREKVGLQALVDEIFPIKSYDQSISLDFLHYELGEPRYTPDECRALKLTYGAPLMVKLRLNRDNKSLDEDVYLGELPLMIGGGEFIINGAERVIVNQLHRSPGSISETKSMPGDRWSCDTTTRSAPLMMNSPPPSMIGRSPR